MLTEKQAILDRIAAFDHTERPDVQELSKSAFEDRIESLVLEWMLELKTADSSATHSADWQLRRSVDGLSTPYTQLIESSGFQMVPPELADDVEATGTASAIRYAVDSAVCTLAIKALNTRLTALNPELVPGFRPSMEARVDRRLGLELKVKLHMQPESIRARLASSCASCWDCGGVGAVPDVPAFSLGGTMSVAHMVTTGII